MMPFTMSSPAIMRPGMLRALPARSIRAHAGISAENAGDTMTSAAQERVETAPARLSTDIPEIAQPVMPATPQPPAPEASTATQAKHMLDASPDEISLPFDISKTSVPDTAGQDKLDMSDILPNVKAPEPEVSVAEKMESMFNKASNMFQKFQPDVPSAQLPEESSAVPESSSSKMMDMLDSIKEATNEMAQTATQKAAPPALSPPSIPDPPPPTQGSGLETVVSKVQKVQESVQGITQSALPAAEAPTAPSASYTEGAVSSATPSIVEPAGPGPVARALEYTDSMMDRAEDVVGSFIDNATGQATNLMQNMGEGVYNTMPKSLPPNLQPKADQIGGNIAAAKAVYDDAPGVYLLLALLAIGSSAYTYWKVQYGGYKGVYTPVDLLEALNREENVFVVDIRPEEDLNEKGVLDLKRQARGKATHLPLVDVPDAVKGDIDNSQRLQLQLNAALVTSLNEVNRFTKIIVMDGRGTSVKGLARAITQQGYRGYMLGGGFSAWKSGGLAVKSGSYAVTPADLLADKGEELSEAAEQTAEKLRQPRNAAIAVLTLASAVAVYLYPHESFRLIGVLGIELTILLKLLSYESPSAAVDDVNKSFQSIRDSFSNVKAQAAEFADVAQARSSSTPQPPAPEKPAEVPQKISPVSEARESVAAEAVKEAQAALERMVAQSKETKPPPVPAPQAISKAIEKNVSGGKAFVSAAEDGKPAALKPADGKPAASAASDSIGEQSNPAATGFSGSVQPLAPKAADTQTGTGTSGTRKPRDAKPVTAVSSEPATSASADKKTDPTKPAQSKPFATVAAESQPAATKPVPEAKGSSAGKWPESDKKEDVVPPKPVVDSLPYVSQDGKTRKGKEGKGGAKPATNKK